MQIVKDSQQHAKMNIGACAHNDKAGRGGNHDKQDEDKKKKLVSGK